MTYLDIMTFAKNAQHLRFECACHPREVRKHSRWYRTQLVVGQSWPFSIIRCSMSVRSQGRVPKTHMGSPSLQDSLLTLTVGNEGHYLAASRLISHNFPPGGKSQTWDVCHHCSPLPTFRETSEFHDLFNEPRPASSNDITIIWF